MRTARTLTVLALAFALLAAGPAEAKKKRRGKAPTEVGTYTDWNGEIDRLEVVESFAVADYAKVVVGELATDDVPLPEPDDNSYEAVQEVLGDVATPLANGIREQGGGLAVDTGGEGGAGVLLLRFTQERRSGVGAFGGGYVELLRRNLFAIGEDLGSGLQRF